MEDAEAPLLDGADKGPLVGVSDFWGRPVRRSTSGGWRSALFILVVEVSGSFALLGVSANLITYLTGPLGHSNAAAAAAVNAWSGTASLMPLLGAFLADSFLGRYRSIILAYTLYVLGYGMITLASALVEHPSSLGDGIDPAASSLQVAFFYAALYLIAMAQGVDKPCGLAFAADQFDPDHPKERASRSSIFNWWFFSTAAGVCVSFVAVSYIQENVGWGVGYGLLCILMLCTFIVFLIGTPTYRMYVHTPGAESPLARLAHSLAALARTRSSSGKHDKEEDVAEEARRVLRLVPIWAACLAYGVVCAQVMTLFNKQGRTMERRFFGGFEFPPAALQTLGAGSVLVFVPIYDHVLVPTLRGTTGNPSGLTMLQRMGIGMVISLAAVSLAALVEARRLQVARDHGLVDDPSATVPMSCAWLVPQYMMMAVADVFAMVGMQEFFYDQMPNELRSMGLALYLSIAGIGGFISSALISFIDHVTSSGGSDSWFTDNLNRAHLDYFYWLLAGISAAELVLYLWLATSYVYNNRKRIA
uniref:Uncharacterized protein n=3 Tax=Avena sativa TaxID=4498 RepID=A0ACD5Y333_AVESA